MSIKMKVGLASAILSVVLTASAFIRHASIVPQAYAEESHACTDHTLVGRYGFTGQGFFGASAQAAADVGIFVSDGQGNISSGSDTLSSGGQVISRTFTGTYSVNSDCTGTVALQFNPGGTVDVAIVLDDRGHEVRALQTNPPSAVFTAMAKRVD